jgi:hypothetical protein
MNHNSFNTIDPSQFHVPDSAVIQKVLSDNDRLPAEQHDKAVKAFFVSDGIASGIGKDLAFVDQIPNLIKEIIDNSLWECLYVAKSVVTAYYCRYTKGTDSENFRAFITAKRPNGLETSVETLDRVLQADLEVQRKFRAIIYESRQGERADLIDETSGYDSPKLLDERHQKRIRAANRAAEAIPEVAELLDRGLIAIDVAAQLGRDIKDPENLTAEEREYVDKRDLVGMRLAQYIYTNPIPEDEDREPVYSRELNNYVKDLLGIKDRSKSVRMDNPKKAAEKLLQFYQGDVLGELITHLTQGLNANIETCETASEHSNHGDKQCLTSTALSPISPLSSKIGKDSTAEADKNRSVSKEIKSKSQEKKVDTWVEPEESPMSIASRTLELASSYNVTETEVTEPQNSDTNMELTSDELAKHLQVKPETLRSIFNKDIEKFPKWTKKHDPNGMSWQRSDKKKGRSWLFIPVKETESM